MSRSGQPGTSRNAAGLIDQTMGRATEALEGMRYFEGAALCRQAMTGARRLNDFDLLARVCMPHLEARRQIRQLGEEACGTRAALVRTPKDLSSPVEAGCYVLCPPMIGLEGRQLREHADGRETPVFVLVREPLTRDGRWPVVAVGPVVVRVRLEPPGRVERVESSATKDDWDGSVDMAWCAHAHDELGRRAIADAEQVADGDPPAFLVDDLLERLVALPEHEGLHQRLAEACRAAAGEPETDFPRRRATIRDPFSF